MLRKAPNITVAAAANAAAAAAAAANIAATTTTTAITFISRSTNNSSSSISSSNEKLNKYKDLENEVRRMWKVMTKIVPVITGTLVTIKKGLYQNLQLLPGHPLAIELQKITQMSSAHIICKMLG